MREAGEDELIDAQTPVGQQLVRDLARVTDDGRPQVDPYLRDAVPKAGRALAQLPAELSLLAHHRRPLESVAALRNDALIRLRHELVRRVPGLPLAAANNKMGAQSEDGRPAGGVEGSPDTRQ